MSAITERLNTALAGRYEIERELGAGGMATVFLAHDVKHDRHVALKVLKPELAAVLGAERFVVEIKTTAAMQHPHILPLFDSGAADGFLFYVMPFIEGETLRDKLNRETQLGVDEAVRIAREVLDALQYAHEHGIVHRDVKPENILLHGGHAMVADFGIALAVSAAAGGRMTETGLSLGTPHYMSPEQATAEKEITARSDVYSLGSVLFEMLTGQPPHIGGSAQQIIMKIITESAPAVTTLRKSVPPNVAAAVAKSLEKLPADRFKSAKEFSEALANPTFTSATSTGATATTPLGHLRSARDAAFAVAGALIVATVWWSSGGRSEAPLAVHFTFATAPNQPMAWYLGRRVALSPDGRTIVYATADSAGHARLFSRALDDLGQKPIAGTDGATFPTFSPDGRWISFFASGQLKKIPIDGGSATALADLQGLQGASWGEGGIVVSAGGKLVSVPSGGGAPVPLLGGDSTFAFWPVLLPGGKAVVYTSRFTANGEIAATVIANGSRKNLGVEGTPVGVAGGRLIFGKGDGTLMAAPFDIDALRVTGPAIMIAAEVAQNNATGEAKAAISASGSLAYVGGSTSVQVVVTDMNGGVRATAIPAGRLNDPRFAHDGRRVVADVATGGRTDIYIYDINSGAAQRVTSEGSSNFRPEWSPDDARVLFQTARTGQHSTLWWQLAGATAGAQERLAIPGKDVNAGLLTHDGKIIIFRTGAAGTADIWYRRLEGDTTVFGVATTRFNELAPRISPDGRWIAYVSDESGAFEVYVRPFPGPGAQIPVSVGGGSAPVWSPDGRRIFYMRGNRMVAASVAPNPTFSVSKRDVLFEGDYINAVAHASFDVAPDGKSFLMLRPVDAGGEQIVVIPNWAAEFRAQTVKK